MKNDNSGILLFVCIVTTLAFYGFGFITGCFLSHNAIWKSLEKAGISRLITHETTVDGNVTTNWVEIIWKDGVVHNENK